MALQFSTDTRNDWLDKIDDRANAGAGPATIEIRTGSPPANCAASDTGTLLGTLTCSDPMFGAAGSGSITASAIADDATADATGTPGHFRLKDSNGTCVMQGTSGVGSGDLPFDSSIAAGGTISISAFVVVAPGA